jgi:lysozyme family protein
MSAQFDPAFRYGMLNEDYNLTGAITPEPRGGFAKYGINSLAHPDVDLQTLTLAGAEQIEEQEYWFQPGLGKLVNQQFASKLYDTGLNLGIGSAIELAQAILHLDIDGVLGSKTLAAINGAETPWLINAFAAAQADHYRARAKECAAQGKAYPLKGLLARAAKLPPA